ncbi:MAG: NAD+ synthase, partial [Acidobacteria bacterium]|nr:NAD+ synthase [Acidobacteriota bacterium]
MLRLALCQANLPVGDLAGNVERMRREIRRARDRGSDLVVFPELALTGYPPEDLLLKASFVREAAEAARELAAEATGIVAIVGLPVGAAPGAGAAALHNAAVVLADGRVAATYHKHHLPNYAVFDERRYFAPGRQALVIEVRGRRIGLTICEDIWMPGGPADWAAAEGGAELLVNLSASPYHRDKGRERESLFAARCRRQRCGLAFCNAVGGQDELVFDGHSLVIGPDGTVIARGAQFEEELLVVDIEERPGGGSGAASEAAAADARVATASIAAPP